MKKRRHERFQVNLEGTFSTNDLICSNSILNISLGGLCMECGKSIAPREEVTVIIPSKPPVKAPGEVAWCKKVGLSYRLGIRFYPLSLDQKRALTQFISGFFWETKAR